MVTAIYIIYYIILLYSCPSPLSVSEVGRVWKAYTNIRRLRAKLSLPFSFLNFFLVFLSFLFLTKTQIASILGNLIFYTTKFIYGALLIYI
jgi:hypothetical protein